MSDTHGRRPLMRRVADKMTTEHGVQLIVHLGDDYADAEELRQLGYHVLAVPGLWCDEYQKPGIRNSMVEHIDGVSIGCAHADKDWGPRERAADIVMCGHTHRPALSRSGKRLHLNPGHLKGEFDRGEAATYATVTIEGTTVRAAIHELDGSIRQELRVDRSGAGVVRDRRDT